jgi:hypothetical protein
VPDDGFQEYIHEWLLYNKLLCLPIVDQVFASHEFQLEILPVALSASFPWGRFATLL